MQQVKDASRVDLKNVTMKIYGKDGQTYDLVKSAAATFNTNEKSLYSEGAVEITLNLPKEGQPAKPPTVIKTSGLTCDSEIGARRYRPAFQLRLRKGRRQGQRRNLRSRQPRTADEERGRDPLESARGPCQAHEDRSHHPRLARDHQRDLAQTLGTHDARNHGHGRQRRCRQTRRQGDPQHHRRQRPWHRRASHPKTPLRCRRARHGFRRRRPGAEDQRQPQCQPRILHRRLRDHRHRRPRRPRPPAQWQRIPPEPGNRQRHTPWSPPNRSLRRRVN